MVHRGEVVITRDGAVTREGHRGLLCDEQRWSHGEYKPSISGHGRLLCDDLLAAGLCEERVEGAHGQEDELQRRRGELRKAGRYIGDAGRDLSPISKSGAGAGRRGCRGGVGSPALEAADDDG